MKFQKYENTKPSEIPWIGEIPEDWDVKPLFVYCKENHEKNNNGKNDNVLSLSYGNIIRRDVADNFGLIPESFNSYQILKPGMLVLRLTDLQNDKKSLRVGLVKESGIITSAYVGLLPNSEIHPEYLYFLLHSYDISKVFYGMGGGVRQSLKFSDLKSLPLPILSLDEQKQIIKFLIQTTSEIDSKIHKNQKLIELLKDKKQIIINQAVTKGLDHTVPMKNSNIRLIGDIPKTWKVRKIKYLDTKIMKGIFDLSSENYFEEGVPYLRISDIKNNLIDLKKTVRIKNEISHMNENSELHPGDIVLSKVVVKNMDEKIAIIPESIKKCNLNQNLIGIKINKIKIHPEYFLYCLQIKKIMYYVISQSNVTTMAMIRLEFLRELEIPLPEIDEQKQIVSYLNDKTSILDLIILETKSHIKKLEEYRQSLIFSCVTGKIKIKN